MSIPYLPSSTDRAVRDGLRGSLGTSVACRCGAELFPAFRAWGSCDSCAVEVCEDCASVYVPDERPTWLCCACDRAVAPKVKFMSTWFPIEVERLGNVPPSFSILISADDDGWLKVGLRYRRDGELTLSCAYHETERPEDGVVETALSRAAGQCVAWFNGIRDAASAAPSARRALGLAA